LGGTFKVCNTECNKTGDQKQKLGVPGRNTIFVREIKPVGELKQNNLLLVEDREVGPLENQVKYGE
jgi:hypothetical protein